jgi:hypothetical protein
MSVQQKMSVPDKRQGSGQARVRETGRQWFTAHGRMRMRSFSQPALACLRRNEAFGFGFTKAKA